MAGNVGHETGPAARRFDNVDEVSSHLTARQRHAVKLECADAPGDPRNEQPMDIAGQSDFRDHAAISSAFGPDHVRQQHEAHSDEDRCTIHIGQQSYL